MKKYLTIDEADVIINAPKNMKITEDELQSISNFIRDNSAEKDMKQKIKELQRYGEEHYGGVIEDEEGEYIKLEDVLKLLGQ